MKLLAELKRRNVIRVALAYAVVAWFIVQAADVLLGNFGAPSWVFKTVTSLLALGFPLVLFLSWVYDLTPGGLQKTDNADAAPGSQTIKRLRQGCTATALFCLLGAAVAAPASPDCPDLSSLQPTPVVEARRGNPATGRPVIPSHVATESLVVLGESA